MRRSQNHFVDESAACQHRQIDGPANNVVAQGPAIVKKAAEFLAHLGMTCQIQRELASQAARSDDKNVIRMWNTVDSWVGTGYCKMPQLLWIAAKRSRATALEWNRTRLSPWSGSF